MAASSGIHQEHIVQYVPTCQAMSLRHMWTPWSIGFVHYAAVIYFHLIILKITFHLMMLLWTACWDSKNILWICKKRILVPFELDEFKNSKPLFDMDLSFNSFTYIHSNIIQSSRYYTEDPFGVTIMANLQCDKYFAMIHLSMPSSAANWDNCISYLEYLYTKFSNICLTEVWLNETHYDFLKF